MKAIDGAGPEQIVRAMDDADAWLAIVAHASAPYRRAGRFAWHFARGKLRWDPVFRHLLARGILAPRTRVLDVGCGQALLASLVAAAGDAARQGCWPAGWAEPPIDVRVAGIELRARDVERARAALGDRADIVCGDMRTTAFPPADTIVLLDVLHYVGAPEQDAVLARARAGLATGGRLIVRVGDASSARRFQASLWVDRAVAWARGREVAPRAARSARAWRAQLEQLGFVVTSEPMHAGTPFANVLLVGIVEAHAPASVGASRPAATIAHA